jgi:beta-barrel assembly-enhancing protease
MSKSFATKWVSILAATSMLAVPGLAAQQAAPGPSQPAAQQTTSQPASTSAPSSQAQSSQSGTQGSSTTQAPASTPSQGIYVPPPATQTPPAVTPQTADNSSNTSAAPSTPTNATPKGVKPGSENDVDAIGNRNVGKGLDFYSIQHEIELGKQLSQEVEKTAKFINDPIVVEYVNRVGQNLVRNSDCRVPFTIKVIDSDEVNAFALPGGFFYVNSGLILRADEESELAGVMGHEIAHVCARHGTKQATKGDIAQIASIPAMIFIPYSLAGYALYQGLNFGIPLAFLKFSRDDEREADYLGLQYMYKAGYDPNSFVTFFEKVEADEKKQPGTIPKVFADHPPTPDRIGMIQNEIATILPPKTQYIVSTSEFDSVKARLQMIENNVKLNDAKNPNKPTLRKRTDQNKGGSTNPNSPSASDPNNSPSAGSGQTAPSDDDGPPTLKRRPDDGSTTTN